MVCARLADDVGSRDTYTQEDVEHWSAEAGRETHYGRDGCNARVGYQVCKGVSHCEDCDSDNGVGETEDRTQRLCCGYTVIVRFIV